MFTRRRFRPFSVVLAFLLAGAMLTSACSENSPSSPSAGPSTPPTYTLTGTVTASNGQPITGATVTVKDAAPNPNAGKSASTDGSGKYTITSLTPQDFTIGVIADGYVSVERTIQPTMGATVIQAEFVLTALPADAPPASPPPSSPTLPPPSPPSPPLPPAVTYSVSGRVTSSTGGPLGNVTIAVTNSGGDPNTGKSTTADASGNYVLSGLTAGTIQLAFTATGYTRADRSAVVGPDNPSPTLNVELTPVAPGSYSISGRVIGAGGLAVSGATVTIKNAAPDPNAGKNATTDASGNYRLANLARGTVQLEVSASGYVKSERSVALTTDQANPTSDFSLTPAVSAYVIAGTVVNEANSPVAGAKIEITDSSVAANTGKSATTDATGKYRIEGLAFSIVNTLLASATNHKSTSRNVSLTFGTELATANFTLEAGETSVTLKGVVTSTTGQKIAGATVSTPATWPPPNGNRTTTTDSNGNYVITGLAPSTVLTVTFQANGYSPSTLEATLGGTGGTVTLNATLIQNGAIGSPVTIGFNGVATNKAPYSGHTESGFLVEPSAVSWFGSSYGTPGPAVHFETASGTTQTGKLTVTGDGRPFVFSQVNLYSSVTQIPWDFRGFRSGVEVFHTSGTRGNTFGEFVTVQNANASSLVDRLEISVTNPLVTGTCPSPPCLNPIGVDNIVVSY